MTIPSGSEESTSRAREAATAPTKRWFSWFQLFAIGYLLVVIGIAIVIRFAGDRTWWGTLAIFGPRWLCGLPLLILAPWSLLQRSPRRAVAVWLAVLVVGGPIMGVNAPWRKWLGRDAPLQVAHRRAIDHPPSGDEKGETDNPSAEASHAAPQSWRLKLITCNTGGLEPDELDLLEVVEDNDRNVIVFQETSPEKVPKLAPKGWHCGPELASRYPIKLKANEIDNGALGYWGGFAEIYEVASPVGIIEIINVHLQTPRKGIQAFLEGQRDAQSKLTALQHSRSAVSNRAQSLMSKSDFPVVVAGDFNMPIESVIYQRDWAILRNAFTVSGWGIGNTKFTRLHGARIDHVLVDGHWRIDACWVGPDVHSDHRPVLADLTLTVVTEP